MLCYHINFHNLLSYLSHVLEFCLKQLVRDSIGLLATLGRWQASTITVATKFFGENFWQVSEVSMQWFICIGTILTTDINNITKVYIYIYNVLFIIYACPRAAQAHPPAPASSPVRHSCRRSTWTRQVFVSC
jgi:predicted transglutaminase-like protease